MPPEESYDTSLFPDAESAKEAAANWGGGQEELEKGQPVGTLQVEIVDATFGPSASSGRMQIHYHLKVLLGESKDVELHKYDGVGTPKQAAMTQSQLARLGVNTKAIKLSTLPATLLTLKGKRAEVKCQKNGEFHNIYFQKMLGELVGGDAKAPAASSGDPKKKRRF